MLGLSCPNRKFIPSVIEPSFGVGRIIYCMFEHCYYNRDGDDKRTVFRFTPVVAPVKATVFPLVAKPELNALANDIASKLTKAGLSSIVDTTGSNPCPPTCPCFCFSFWSRALRWQ
jgi:glycyl-tRNA synthetase